MHSLQKRNYSIGSLITLLAAGLLSFSGWQMGKQPLFLLLNGDGGKWSDHFFHYFTETANGAVWILVLIAVVFMLQRKDSWVLVVAGFVLSTIFTQSAKHLLFSGEPRPTAAIADLSLVHTVTGVELHTADSFPSGHTATAFTIYLVLCLLVPGRWWIVVGGIYALLAAYSRVYLAQHFPTDLAGGMLIAVVSSWLAQQIQSRVWKRKSAN